MSLLSFRKQQPESDKQVNLTAEMAKRCLNMEEFKAYRESFEAMERKIIDEMVMDAAGFTTQNESTERFGMKCLIKLTRIRDLRALLNKVSSEARKVKSNA